MNATKPQDRPWRRVALPASLVLNLFLAALVGGHLLRSGTPEAARGLPPLAQAIANAAAVLSAPDAAAFRASIRLDAPHDAVVAKQLDDARGVLERDIIAEPFDKQLVRRDLAAWQAAWNKFIDNAGNTLVEALSKISPEGRRRLVAQRHQALVGAHN
jgi:hypothetical protein